MTLFAAKTYGLLRKVPRGRVTTYKALAKELGITAYRAIGQLMKRNPLAPQVPCHRVVASDGTIGGFMGASRGEPIKRKKRLLTEEGIIFMGNKIVDFERVLFKFG